MGQSDDVRRRSSHRWIQISGQQALVVEPGFGDGFGRARFPGTVHQREQGRAFALELVDEKVKQPAFLPVVHAGHVCQTGGPLKMAENGGC
jgi:hypothetical protein